MGEKLLKTEVESLLNSVKGINKLLVAREASVGW